MRPPSARAAGRRHQGRGRNAFSRHSTEDGGRHPEMASGARDAIQARPSTCHCPRPPLAPAPLAERLSRRRFPSSRCWNRSWLALLTLLDASSFESPRSNRDAKILTPLHERKTSKRLEFFRKYALADL